MFPGGSVDARDADEQETGWAGPDPAECGQLFDVPADQARALVCAAVRETFEESGVLLAGPAGRGRGGQRGLAEDRQALLDRSLSLAELLARRGLVLRADLLTPVGPLDHPVVEPRRFDTWFFAAALPAGQRTGRGRRSQPGWPSPDRASRLARGGGPLAALEAAGREITLLPPTAVTLAELAAYQDVARHLAARRVIAPLLPEVVLRGRAGVADPARRDWSTRCDHRRLRHGQGACVLAPNPSLMTLDGTNTWLIAEPGSPTVAMRHRPGPGRRRAPAPGAGRGGRRASAG